MNCVFRVICFPFISMCETGAGAPWGLKKRPLPGQGNAGRCVIYLCLRFPGNWVIKKYI